MPTAPGRRLRQHSLAALHSLIQLATRRAGLVNIASHHLYAPALGPDSTSIDAGANVGDFSRGLLDRAGGRVVALEPVPELCARMTGIAPGTALRTVAGALTASDGQVEFHLSDNPEANSLDADISRRFGYRDSIQVRGWSLASLLAEAGLERADLLKLDIEGAELEVLEQTPQATLQAFDQITVEFHDFLDDGTSTRRILAIRQRLAGLGFRDIVLSSPWGHHADVLFLNRARIRLTSMNFISFLFLKRVALPARGLVHRWRGRSA